MDTKFTAQIYNSILYTLSNSDSIFSKDELKEKTLEFIKGSAFSEALDAIVQNSDYSCSSILRACEVLLAELSGNDQPKDWLAYTYQYTLNKSFPQAVTIELEEKFETACLVYLNILRILAFFQKTSNDKTWQSKYPLHFLSEDEKSNLENPTEYEKFINAFNEDYVYEMMKLNQETLGHNTLDHICGVQYLAMFIGRQLHKAGFPIDLGRVFCAATGHDIGKYGCKTIELKRVPYLHYYYTDQWFKKHDIIYAGHIAVNHSTWDLELENLSIESLILIYSDFRVKNLTNEKSKNTMHIYNLKDSFDVILSKLDNVDEAKEKRYKRVYAKLKDFEDFMLNIGIQTELDIRIQCTAAPAAVKKPYYSLMQGAEIIENIKYLSINHNINLMYQLRDEYSLNLILEFARSESDWKKLREYIRIFEEYSTHLTQKQKLITMKFLYDQLIHPEDDIRRQCAELIGILIAAFDEDYRKEVPQDVIMDPPEITSFELLDKYLNHFIFPDHKIIPLHRSWIGYSIRIMVSALFSHCRKKQIPEYRQVLAKYFSNEIYKSDHNKLYILESVKYLPLWGDDESVRLIYDYVIKMLGKNNDLLRISALDTVYSILLHHDNTDYDDSDYPLYSTFIQRLEYFFSNSIMRSEYPSENFIKLKIAENLKLGSDVTEKYAAFVKRDAKRIPSTFLGNLKTATDWVIKRAQVDLLLDYALMNPEANGFYTAMHFCNLLKVSAFESVRNRAGEALVEIIPHISIEQRNDVAIELLRALEIDGYQFAEYIPAYLGRIVLYLQPKELDELLDDFTEKIKQAGPQLISLLLKTVGIAVVNYGSYAENFTESKSSNSRRLTKMIGIILNGLVHYNLHVKQVSFSVLGKEIFGSKLLELEDKNHIFLLTAKKILTLITNNKNEELLFLTNSAGLNNIYRFISDYTFFKGSIDIPRPDKVAFFPGTFDPFSLSHKEIVKAIRNLGYEVYLAVDEFSWSKRTLPNLIRRNIINMSIADELNIYLYPEDFPINIANPLDLKTLKRTLEGSELYIVVGSDVVINASAYKAEPVENSIHSFAHIVFERKNMFQPNNQINNIVEDNIITEALSRIRGEVVRLTLAPQYEDISSTQIRNYIDENRDISMLIDPLVQNYIYENGFYQKEPQYKSLIQSISIDIEVVENINHELIDELSSCFYQHYNEISSSLHEFTFKPSSRLIVIRDENRFGRVIGFSAFHRIHSATLYRDLKSSRVTEYIRENSVGKTVLIDGIFVCKSPKIEYLDQILLTETLAYCLSKDYEYCVFSSMTENYPLESVERILELQGFIKLHTEMPDRYCHVVNMSAPSSLILDVKTYIKEPFKNNRSVTDAIARTRTRLQSALAKLYPGYLTLSFNRNILYETLVKKICAENRVPITTITPKTLGPAMCVPYGNILNKSIVPNTVTKSLHTEKMFSPDVEHFDIASFPYYLDLKTQIRMLKSFGRPIILVDDVLHKGYRIQALDPILKKENINVQKIIVGILSGRGRELMEIQNRQVDSAYFIPKLRHWHNEASFYPFIGGDALWRGVYPQRNLLPSINLILPYTSPNFMRNASSDSIFRLSEVSIENALDLLTTLEQEYQYIYERSLTMTAMGKVFVTPRCPDYGKNMSFDLNVAPSNYLMNDLELLHRLQSIIK
ncbi:MAG: cytidyltransferase [Bacillota bacterium]